MSSAATAERRWRGDESIFALLCSQHGAAYSEYGWVIYVTRAWRRTQKSEGRDQSGFKSAIDK